MFKSVSWTYLQFPKITWWLSIYKLTKTTSIQTASLTSEKIEHENIDQLATACFISRLIPAVWSHVIYACVGEPVDFVYFRGKRNAGVIYIKTDRPIWKQSSNVSWKNRYVMVQGTSRGCQRQYFPSRLATDVVMTGLMFLSASLRGHFSERVCISKNEGIF